MNCRIGKFSLFAVMATLASNAVANEPFINLYNLVNTSTDLVNQSKECVTLAQSSMQDKSKFERVKENKIEILEGLFFICLMFRAHTPICRYYFGCGHQGCRALRSVS